MRRIYTKRVEHVDSETGEITHTESSSSFFVKSRHFAKVYLDALFLLKDLSGGARVLLDIMIVEMEFNTNKFYMNKRDRERIAIMLGRSEHTIRNYVYELTSAGVINKTGTNVYMVNPEIFGKGDKNHTKEYEPTKRPQKRRESPL